MVVDVALVEDHPVHHQQIPNKELHPAFSVEDQQGVGLSVVTIVLAWPISTRTRASFPLVSWAALLPMFMSGDTIEETEPMSNHIIAPIPMDTYSTTGAIVGGN